MARSYLTQRRELLKYKGVSDIQEQAENKKLLELQAEVIQITFDRKKQGDRIKEMEHMQNGMSRQKIDAEMQVIAILMLSCLMFVRSSVFSLLT
jgi:hypothetical protein